MRSLLKTVYKTGVMAILCNSLLTFSSCVADDTIVEPKGNSLSFKATISDEWVDVMNHRAVSQSTVRYGCSMFDDETHWLLSKTETNIKGATFGENMSRAVEVDEENFYDSFKVYGYVYDATGSWTDSAIKGASEAYIDGLPTLKNENVWTLTPDKYWPSAQYKIKFFAYAPVNHSNITLSTTNHCPEITYTVPKSSEDQIDLLVADLDELTCNTHHNPVNLTFSHALTAVKIKAKNDINATITNIKIEGVLGNGTYSLDENAWDLSESQITNYDEEVNVTLPGGAGSSDVINGNQTFMLIPQSLPENAVLKATIDGLEYTASLAGKEWPMGHTVTYVISLTNYILEVTSPDDFLYNGTNVKEDGYTQGTPNYSVTSYKLFGKDDTTPEAVPWAMDAYSIDGGETWIEATELPATIYDASYDPTVEPERTTWLTQFTWLDAEGGEKEYTSAVAVKPISIDHDAILKSRDAVNGTYDLSTWGGNKSQNTANCYLVNAAGTYSFPLVYGNAIANGETRENAYKTTNTGNGILSHFKNHLGEPISSPYIYKNGNCVPYDACIVWQDEENLITEVELEGGESIQFTTSSQTDIKQGNAIIAVRNQEGTIMWSWHIWVTDYVMGEGDLTVTNYTGQKNVFMPHNLGWCYVKDVIYNPQNVHVRIKQEGSNNTDVIVVNQLYDRFIEGNNPYYQWGRKDPMRGTLSSKVAKPVYGPEDYTPIVAKNTYTSLGNTIQNPYIFYGTGGGDWGTGYDNYYNNWNMEATGELSGMYAISKTIYDPSPVGYSTYPGNATSGFTYNGGGASGFANINTRFRTSSEYTSHFGMEFYCNPMKPDGTKDPSGGLIFFPATDGIGWNATHQVANFGSTAMCWSGGVYNLSYARSIGIVASTVYPQNDVPRSCGFPVRAVKETNGWDFGLNDFEQDQENVDFDNK